MMMFDSAVVVANSEDDARKIVPAFRYNDWRSDVDDYLSWVRPEEVKVEFIGVVDEVYLDKLDGRTTVVSNYND
jgi:hypothetical protein